MIERSNRGVKDALATFVGEHPEDWDNMLPFVRLALNSAVHRSVGQQPLYLLTGKDGYFPPRYHERARSRRRDCPGVEIEPARRKAGR